MKVCMNVSMCARRRPTLGFLRPGTADEVLHIQDCHLAPTTTSAILQSVRHHVDRLGLLPANDPTGKGCLLSVVVRHAAEAWHNSTHSSGHAGSSITRDDSSSKEAVSNPTIHEGSNPCIISEIPKSEVSVGCGSHQEAAGVFMVVISTTESAPVTKLEDLAQSLVNDVPLVVGVVQRIMTASGSTAKNAQTAVAPTKLGTRNSKTSKNSSAQPGKPSTASKDMKRKSSRSAVSSEDEGSLAGNAQRRVLAGAAHIVEHMCGLRFRVSPESFFQTNTKQAEVLYGAVAAASQLKPEDTLLDLYCGTGSIGLSLARQCKHVLGYEAIGERTAVHLECVLVASSCWGTRLRHRLLLSTTDHARDMIYSMTYRL